MAVVTQKTNRTGARKLTSKGSTLVVRSGVTAKGMGKSFPTKVAVKGLVPKKAKGDAAKLRVYRKAASKKAAKSAGSHILSAPKGARVLTHREIKKAVETVFEERHATDG